MQELTSINGTKPELFPPAETVFARSLVSQNTNSVRLVIDEFYNIATF